MGHRGRGDVVASARARASDGTPVGTTHGRCLVRDADQVCEGRRDIRWRYGRPNERRAGRLQDAYPARLYDLPGLAVHAHDPHLERGRRAGLSV